MLSLKDRVWRPFHIEEILEITPCKFTGKGVTEKGSIPYVGATNRNNGVLDFLNVDKNTVIKGNCIVFICNGDGSIGFSVYRETDFVGSVDVKIGRSKYLNKYVGMFMSSVSDKNRGRYSFGYKRTIPRINKETIMLPVNADGDPDYVFMEEYMKQIESKLLSAYKEYLGKIPELPTPDIISIKNWRPFKVTDLFIPQKGNQNNMNALSDGCLPLISAKKMDNGLKTFVGENSKRVYDGHCISINNDGDGGAGLTYYHPYKMYLDSHVTALYSKVSISKYSYLFMAKCLEKQECLFGHAHALTRERLNALSIMLPANNDNEPDYEFMDRYMRRVEAVLLRKYLDYKGN